MGGSGISAQVLAGAVELACRAPSVHNSQPWRWTVEDETLRLFVEPHRVPRATDHAGREALISCGALLDHLRVAAAAAGWQADVARFPNPNALEHLATVEFHRRQLVTAADRARADAILRRRTDRLPFAAPPSWPAFEDLLRRTIDPENATLHVLGEATRAQLADASRLTEALRRNDPSYQAELSWWTGLFETADGVPHSALVSASDRDRVEVARTFPAGDFSGDRPSADHSVILALCAYDDSHASALGCGEALSGVLLEATMARLSTCTLTHLTELDASRDILRSLIGGTSEPQLLIRIGRVPELGEHPPMTPRRPLADVLRVGPPDDFVP
jgi:hypothetical protein